MANYLYTLAFAKNGDYEIKFKSGISMDARIEET